MSHFLDNKNPIIEAAVDALDPQPEDPHDLKARLYSLCPDTTRCDDLVEAPGAGYTCCMDDGRPSFTLCCQTDPLVCYP